MFRLPVLPPELRVPLDECVVNDVVVARYPGVVAVVRPLSIEEESTWHDAFPGVDHASQAATSLVFQQLIRIEGLVVTGADGTDAPFDPANPEHKRSFPMAMRSVVYRALVSRAEVGDGLEKNSDSPSGSGGTSDTAASSADAAASGSATS